ncbi:MAG: YjjG family noncanonical pyrimidine nucleotidase [Oscillospiraceae bacterium]
MSFNFDLLLFDADGTLLDFKKAEKMALKDLFFILSHSFSEEVLYMYESINNKLWSDFEKGKINKSFLVEERFRQLFEKFNIKNDPQLANKIYLNALTQYPFLIENAKEICSLFVNKIPMIIVTNGITSIQKTRIINAEINSYFGFQKPQIEYFNFVFKDLFKLNIHPPKERCLLIGDSITSDIIGGKNYNIKTCLYNPQNHKNETSVKADFEISNLKQLTNIIMRS